MPLSNAEIDAVINVLWRTYAIRNYYEDRALWEDEVMWKNNGGLFSNFARYHSKKWKAMMGPDDPTVRGRRISQASMVRARQKFEESYREPIMVALELAEKIRETVAKAVKKNGPSADGEYEEEIGRKAWNKIAADPDVKKKLDDLERDL